MLALFGCAITPTPSPPTETPAATVTPVPPTPALTPTPSFPPNLLRVWLPQQFAPGDEAPGGPVLAEQIAAFEQAHPGLTVDVRIKETAGPAGLLPTLLAAHNVAPAALPNVIALNPDDLKAAAEAGLVIPLDGLLPPETLDDYYPFAQAMSQVNEDWMGLPFAADARVLAYNAQIYATPPLTWTEAITGPFILPGAEPWGLTLLNEYLALGGSLTDPSDKLSLDAELLAEALGFFQMAQDAGALPLSTLSYPDTAATWQVFRERRAALAVTSMRWYLAERDRASFAAVGLLPAKVGDSATLAEGWSWAIVNVVPERAALAAELLAWLTAPQQLSEWTQAAQVLPPRASALDGWTTEIVASEADSVLTRARLLPSPEVLNRVGPPLRQALDDVLNGRATPLAAANAAAQAVASGR
ncbi:MAG: ABC transporter substrate-binding protein [Anaerolineales bacterium]